MAGCILRLWMHFQHHGLTLGPVAYKPNFGLYMQYLVPDHSQMTDSDGLIVIINTLLVLNGLGSI